MPTTVAYNVCSGTAWTSSEAVTVGDRRLTSTAKYIECTVAGTTSGVEPNPSTIGGTVTDGGVTWKYLCDQDYAILSDLTADIGVGISDTLVTDDETWQVIIWHRREGAYNFTASAIFSFAESCDATHFVVVKPAPGDAWTDNTALGTDKIQYDEDRGVAFDLTGWVDGLRWASNTSFCYSEKIQIKVTYAISYGFVGGIAKGGLCHLSAGVAGSRYAFKCSRIENCIGISEQTASGFIIETGWNQEAVNCLAIWCGSGTVPSGFKGFKLGHSTLKTINCVAVGCDEGFGNYVVTDGACTGNVSDDATASTAFPTQSNIIDNASDLVTNHSSAVNVDATPLVTSDAFAVNSAETAFTYTPANDVFGAARTIGVQNYRGPIVALAAAAVDLTAQDLSVSPAMAANDLSATVELSAFEQTLDPVLSAGELTALKLLQAQGLAINPAMSVGSLLQISVLTPAQLNILPNVSADELSILVNLDPQALQILPGLSLADLVLDIQLQAGELMTRPELANASLSSAGSLIASGLELLAHMEVTDLSAVIGLDAVGLSLLPQMQGGQFAAGSSLDAYDLNAAIELTHGNLLLISSLEADQMRAIISMGSDELVSLVGLDARSLSVALTARAEPLSSRTTLQAQGIEIAMTMHQAALIIGILKRVLKGRVSWRSDPQSVEFEEGSQSILLEQDQKRIRVEG